MSLVDKTHALLNVAGAYDTTPEKMKSMIAGLRSDTERLNTGAMLRSGN